MKSATFSQPLRRLWALDSFAYSLRVFIALFGALLLSWLRNDMALLIPLFLGIIASALAESDDSWQGRLQALIVTLACFSLAALVVELLFPYPWLFAIGLAISAFVLTLLGALGPRYATIAMATLILAVYTMISIEHRGGSSADEQWRVLLLLVSGAAWYGGLSVLWNALFTHQPVKQSMAAVLKELGDYLIIKSTLFEPLRGIDIHSRRLTLARQNSRVVEAMNQAKEMIFRRMEGQRSGHKLNRYLRLYLIAQDMHERASSSHYPYTALAETFFHHDVLFRCQRLLDQQGRACKALGKAILLRRPFDHGQSEQALADLHASLAYLRSQQNPAWSGLLRSLASLADNLASLERQLANAYNPDAQTATQDASLYDRAPHSLEEAWTRMRLHLSLGSPIFRHALRLAVTLVAGYGLLHLIHPTQGYWILLTSLFVCRPNFGTTRRYLYKRIVGTVVGLIAGWALITLFPGALIQSLIAVAAGVTFFACRDTRYMLATAAITLMVLCCFNQVSDGFGLIWPRLFDTLLGAAIAGLAVTLILPDWQGRRLHKAAAETIASSSRYLREIIQQYATGKQDDLAYRLARRNAHNADAALSTMLASVLQEPGHYRKDADVGFRFLVNSHTLLGYLSALGAHRASVAAADMNVGLDSLAKRIADELDVITRHLAERRPVLDRSGTQQALMDALESQATGLESDEQRLVQTQLVLICHQLTPLSDAASRLIEQEA